MNAGTSRERRVLIIIASAVIWFALMSSAFAFLSGGTIDGMISLLVVAAMVVLTRNPRVQQAVTVREMPTRALLVFAVLAIALIVFESGNLRIQSIVFLGGLEAAALVRFLRASGSLLFAAYLLWELAVIYSQRR